MKIKGIGMAALAALLVLAGSCGRKGRVIPADTFAKINAEMLLSDQWLSSNSKAKRAADTTAFYGPVFHKYGYSPEDYEVSVRHYMHDPKKFSKILAASEKQLTDYSKRLQAVEDEIRGRWKPSPYKKIRIEADTLLWKLDTNIFHRVDTVKVDSLAVSDSTFVLIDSTKVEQPTDTLKYESDRNSEDMLLLHGPDDTTSRGHGRKRKIFSLEGSKAANRVS